MLLGVTKEPANPDSCLSSAAFTFSKRTLFGLPIGYSRLKTCAKLFGVGFQSE